MNLPITHSFPILAIAGSFLALAFPEYFTHLKFLIIPLLMVIMFCMGATLNWNDFSRVGKKPSVIALGVFLQFSVMPLTAYLLSKLLALPQDLTTGMIIVGSCAGGTASNVICFLSRADVALSVTLTLTTTLVSVLLTPVLIYFYVGSTVEIDTIGLFYNLAKIVLLPLLLGLICHHFLSTLIKTIKPFFPITATLAIVFIIMVVVALNAERLINIGFLIFLAVALHNIVGLACGYFIPLVLKFDKQTCRTLSIEIGMQNSGLGTALALKFFAIGAALPGALFSIWHNISGSLLAAYWSQHHDEKRNLSEKT